MDWTLCHQRAPRAEDDNQNRRRVSSCSIALHEDQGSELHDAVDGHGPHLWNDFLLIWPAERDHRPESVHNSRQCCHLERICADANRAEIFPANCGDDACVGTPLPQAYTGIKRGRCGG